MVEHSPQNPRKRGKCHQISSDDIQEFQRNKWVLHRHRLSVVTSSDKSCPKRQLKPNAKCLADFVGMKDEATRLVNEDFSLPVLPWCENSLQTIL